MSQDYCLCAYTSKYMKQKGCYITAAVVQFRALFLSHVRLLLLLCAWKRNIVRTTAVFFAAVPAWCEQYRPGPVTLLPVFQGYEVYTIYRLSCVMHDQEHTAPLRARCLSSRRAPLCTVTNGSSSLLRGRSILCVMHCVMHRLYFSRPPPPLRSHCS